MSSVARSVKERRRFATRLAALLAAVALPTNAQQSRGPTSIGTLDIGSRKGREVLWTAFDEALRNLGYIEGRNVSFERRWGDGKTERLPLLAAELVTLKVGIIVAAGTAAALAVTRATPAIPVVFVGISADPVKAGIASSLSRPGGNVTGFTTLSAELSPKRLGLLMEILPRLQQVAILWDETSAGSKQAASEIDAAARSHGIRVQTFGVNAPGRFDSTFEEIKRAGVDAVVVAPGAMFFSERRSLAAGALKHRICTTFPATEYAEVGGLLAYGVDRKALYRQAASYVDKILKGAKPGELAIMQPSKFELVINTETAKALGIKVPEAVLKRADRVIE